MPAEKMTHPNRHKRATASELMSQIGDRPALRSTLDNDKIRKSKISKHDLDLAPVLYELKERGFDVSSLDELRKGKPYADAIPILVEWLPKISDVGAQESVVRALSVPWARGRAAKALIEVFCGAPEHTELGLKWAIGNALEVVADDNLFEEVKRLVNEKRHGRSREMLALTLGKMTNPAAVDVLIGLLNDDEVAGHAIIALGRLRARRSRGYIEPFLDHPKAWIRREAKKALSRIR